MASYTTNLNLKKPAGSENVAIGDINNNMDTIDQAYGALNGKIGNIPMFKELSANGTHDITVPSNSIAIISISHPYYPERNGMYLVCGGQNTNSAVSAIKQSTSASLEMQSANVVRVTATNNIWISTIVKQ